MPVLVGGLSLTDGGRANAVATCRLLTSVMRVSRSLCEGRLPSPGISSVVGRKVSVTAEVRLTGVAQSAIQQGNVTKSAEGHESGATPQAPCLIV